MAATTEYGCILRYGCPIKSCRERVTYLIHDQRRPPTPHCHGPMRARHRRMQVMTLDGTLPITDHLPWIVQAAGADQEAGNDTARLD